MRVLFTLIAAYLLNYAESANILGVATLISPSHHLWNEVLAVGLAKNGHNVTLLSHDKARVKHENYTIINLEGIYESLDGTYDIESIQRSIALFSMDKLWSAIQMMCEMDMDTNGFKSLWNYPKDYKFDLILWDANAGDCLYPLIKRFGNPPVVVTSPFGLQPFIAEMMGHHVHTYIPFMIFPYTDRMNFWQRLLNAVYTSYVNLVRKYSHLRIMRDVAEKKLGIEVDDFREVERNFSLALVNTDPVYNFPETFPPNIIPVGGIHITPPKPLSKDLAEVFVKSPKGVILFALGTNVKSEKLNKEVLTSFTKCFETLPYTVLWKISPKDLHLPKNVIARPWLPQNDILAQSNTKLFISHCGALSTQEAMYHGVPIVGYPFFYDQINIAEKLTVRKLGEKLDYTKMTPDYVCGKIKQVLDDPTYTKNMKLISKRVKDQPNTPLERGIFWVEYVLRHGGAEHLSLSIRDASVFQSLNLDILCFLVTVAFTIILTFYLVLKRIVTKRMKIKTN